MNHMKLENSPAWILIIAALMVVGGLCALSTLGQTHRTQAGVQTQTPLNPIQSPGVLNFRPAGISQSFVAIRPARVVSVVSDGTYEAEARFVRAASGTVWLKRKDGNVIQVPVEKLSDGDRKWMRDWAKKRSRP